MKLSSTFISPRCPSGQRRGGFEPGRLGPLRKDIRTFVKCFLATTGRNRVGQIGRAGKNPFRRSSASLSNSCYHSLGPRATVFATDFRSPLTQDFSITSDETSSDHTNHTRHWTNDRSLSRDSNKKLPFLSLSLSLFVEKMEPSFFGWISETSRCVDRLMMFEDFRFLILHNILIFFFKTILQIIW